MGRIRALAFVVALLMVAGVLFADYEVIGKDVFPVSRQIATIYAHRLGYKIVFQRDKADFGVFYVDGKFDHIRLYLIRNFNDPTWAVLSANQTEEKLFDIDTLDIAY